MVYGKVLTLEEAEAKFIFSLSNIVWLLAITIAANTFLVFNGYPEFSELTLSLTKIIITALWIWFLSKLLTMIDRLVRDAKSLKSYN